MRLRSPPSGVANVSTECWELHFALLNAVGAILWSLTVAGLGWLFGAAAQALFGEIRHLEGRLLLALALSLAVVWLFRWRRRARRSRSPEADTR